MAWFKRNPIIAGVLGSIIFGLICVVITLAFTGFKSESKSFIHGVVKTEILPLDSINKAQHAIIHTRINQISDTTFTLNKKMDKVIESIEKQNTILTIICKKINGLEDLGDFLRNKNNLNYYFSDTSRTKLLAL